MTSDKPVKSVSSAPPDSQRRGAASTSTSAPSDKATKTTTAEPSTPATAPKPKTLRERFDHASESFSRATSTPEAQRLGRFFSAYGKTWIGMSPIWLLGEAVYPGAKVGSQFVAGSRELQAAAEELRQAVTTATSDVLVIIDRRLQSASADAEKTAEVIKVAGENAIVVVSTGLEKARAQIEEAGPDIQAAVKKHGRDVVVIIDKTLKHPIVITGVTRYARAQGIPRPEALIGLASLGLSKLLEAIDKIPDAASSAMDAGPRIQEIDAGELRRTSSHEAAEEASRVGKVGEGPTPLVEGMPPPAVPIESAATAPAKKRDCQIM